MSHFFSYFLLQIKSNLARAKGYSVWVAFETVSCPPTVLQKSWAPGRRGSSPGPLVWFVFLFLSVPSLPAEQGTEPTAQAGSQPLQQASVHWTFSPAVPGPLLRTWPACPPSEPGGALKPYSSLLAVQPGTAQTGSSQKTGLVLMESQPYLGRRV
jgi:hypothetical protein